ncbi:heme biosynthesis HemY N-terminal domain-containing protein [Utexia brackfieldae]|uniref:heme biosynthesis HemY N-terminal domain-containing protein n=1 Tax=Utexia brackfieldae TaxID=3074108 RepID=UPI00370D6F1B
MIRILIIFLIAAGVIVIAPMLAGHQGMVFFQVAGYRIKMSFTLFILAEVILFFLVYFVYWLLKEISLSHSSIRRFWHYVFPNKSAKKIEDAQLLILEGKYKAAEKLLTKAAKSANHQTLLYLQAAQAAIDANDLISANQLLEQAALTCTDKEKMAFLLVQIRLQIKNNELLQAKKQINKLLDDHPRHPEVIKLASKIYDNLQDYQAIIEMMPVMYKVQLYPETQLDQYKHSAYIGRIHQLANDVDSHALSHWWQAQPKVIRTNLLYQKEVAQSLTQIGQLAEAQKINAQIAKHKNGI